MTLPDQFDHSSTSLATFCDKTNLFEGISPIKKPKSIPKPSVKRKRMVIEDDDDDDDDDDDGDVQDSPFSHLMADVPTKPLTIATKGSSKPSTFLIGNLELFGLQEDFALLLGQRVWNQHQCAKSLHPVVHPSDVKTLFTGHEYLTSKSNVDILIADHLLPFLAGMVDFLMTNLLLSRPDALGSSPSFCMPSTLFSGILLHSARTSHYTDLVARAKTNLVSLFSHITHNT